jgi:hypothetical protein
MNKYLFTALVFLTPLFSDAQIGKVLNRAKSKVNQRVNNKIDESIDEALDEAEGKGKKKQAATTGTKETGTEKRQSPVS